MLVKNYIHYLEKKIEEGKIKDIINEENNDIINNDENDDNIISKKDDIENRKDFQTNMIKFCYVTKRPASGCRSGSSWI